MIKIFLDSGNINEIFEYNGRTSISGFTTNPTLMLKAGVKDYEKFVKDIVQLVGKPISFEVFADDFGEMENQARKISSWGNNIYVKIPIMNTKGESSHELISKLSDSGIKVNVTAVTDYRQIMGLRLNEETPIIISVFAGRIADTGKDPQDIIKITKAMCDNSKVKVLWASPREVLNIYQAEEAGADIITCTPELIDKYQKLKGKDLNEFSLDTVKMFFNDAKEAGYKL